MSGSPTFALEALACAVLGIVLWVACAGVGFAVAPRAPGSDGEPSRLASQPSIGWMHQRLPTSKPATVIDWAIGEPSAAVRIRSSTGMSIPSSARRSRNADVLLSCATFG